MRIIAEFDIEQIKVTVFKMNERISVKYELHLLEQTYKFRDGSGIDTPEDVERFTYAVLDDIKQHFESLSKTRLQGINALNHITDQIWDEIV